MGLLSDGERAGLLPAETASYPSPVPTQAVSSDEFLPVPQTDRQRQVQARVHELGETLGRRRFLPGHFRPRAHMQ